MTALACQIIEPVGNVLRVGASEGASQLQRKVAATVLFIVASTGTSNTIDPNTPAIPWTSGFGSGATPPSTPGTVDLTTFAGRWVTFILAGSNGSTQPMYVCQVSQWSQIAGEPGGRTVIPLDVWELHSWKYAGREFLFGFDLTQHATYTFTTTDIPANADTSNVVTITYPIGYDTSGGAPDVYASSQDSDWMATATPNGSNPHTQLDLFAARRTPLTTPQTGTASPTMLAGHSSVVYSGNPITFPVAYDPASTPVPLILFQTTDPDFVAQATSITPTGFDLTVYYRPNMASGSVDAASTGITVQNNWSGVAGADGSGGDGSTGGAGATHTHSIGGSTGGQSTGHSHAVPAGTDTLGGTTGGPNNDHTHGEGGTTGNESANHTHGIGDAEHDHDIADPQHTHHFSGTATDVSADTMITVVWQSFGTRTAPAATVDVSWLAVGQQALPA